MAHYRVFSLIFLAFSLLSLSGCAGGIGVGIFSSSREEPGYTVCTYRAAKQGVDQNGRYSQGATSKIVIRGYREDCDRHIGR